MMPPLGIAAARAAFTPVAVPPVVDPSRPLELVLGHVTARHGGHVAVHGPTGAGKTELLRALAGTARGRLPAAFTAPFLPVYVDMQAVAPFNADRFWRRATHLMARAAGARVDGLARTLTGRPQIELPDVEAFAHGAAELGVRPVLLLDEFEWAFQTGTPAEAAASRVFLSELATLCRRAPAEIVFVVATEPPLRDLERDVVGWRGSPLSASFAPVEIEGRFRPYADSRSTWPSAPVPTTRRRVEGHAPRALTTTLAPRPGPIDVAGFALSQPARLAWPAMRPLSAVGGEARGEAGCAVVAPMSGVRASAPMTRARTRKPYHRPSFAAPAMVVDSHTGTVIVSGHAVAGLTALEYNLLVLLHRNAGAVCTKAEILERLWGVDAPGSISDTRVEKLVSRLRQRLDQVSMGRRCIRTVRGVGYRYVAPEAVRG
ncbi:hypothetical protein DCC79_02025 [bacterium]|nr:MAG: hypothetical protein DCC79_02025 [bacterium]